MHLVLAKLVVLVLFWCCYATASIRPSFWLESCSWNATDIAVVTPAGGLTQFKIVETIKGDLARGDMLELPGLASTKGRSKKLAELLGDQSTFHPDDTFQDPPPAQPGDRLIVFLRRSGPTEGWQPAQPWGSLLTSAVWIQDGNLYAYLQTYNPGPTHLANYKASEEEVRSQISAVLGLRAAMDQAAAISDPVERSRKLAVLVRSGTVPGGMFARASAIEKLAAGGEAEASTLLDLLSDQSLLGWHQDIIQALAGKPVADFQFGKFLSEETTYWSQACPTLKAGWWNDPNNPEVERLRDHYTRAQALLEAIRAHRLLEPIPQVREFAAAYSRCSAPGDRGEKDQITEELNLVLAAR